MQRLRNTIIGILERRGPATDRGLTEAIFGSDKQHQTINGECRYLEMLGLIARRKGADGIIRNIPASAIDGPTLRLVS
jgi:hypothetical protein